MTRWGLAPTVENMHAAAAVTFDPEAEALEALGRKDRRRALTVLMQGYGDDLYRHCRHVLGDDDLAADVHQTVFVHAYRDLFKFAGRSTLRTWLYGIARHRCLDAIKAKRRRRRRFVITEQLPELADPRPRVDQRLEACGGATALARALRGLKPKVRIAVLLRYHDGLSYEEMAEVCGERAPTLQARVARALPVLRRALEAPGELP